MKRKMYKSLKPYIASNPETGFSVTNASSFCLFILLYTFHFVKSKESKNQTHCHFLLVSSLKTNGNKICLLFFVKKASVQVLQ